MLARLSAVVQDVVVVATSVLKGVGKNQHSVKGTLLVNAFRKDANVGREPGRIDGNGTEGVAEDVSNNLYPCNIGLPSVIS